MIAKRTKTIFIALLALILCAAACMTVLSFGRTGAAETEPLQASYTVGETVGIPERTLTSGSATQNAEIIVHYPSGAAKAANSVTLTEAGRYTVEYRAVIDGKLVKETTYFNAYNELYSFSGDKSTAVWGLDTSIYNTGRTALNISLAQGEIMTFNKIIDLNDFVDSGFITFYFTPKVKGTAEAQGVYFRLTDVYDPDNQIVFQYKNVPYIGQPYVYLAAYVTSGHGGEAPRAYVFNDGQWKIRIADKFGVGSPVTMYGNADEYGGTAVKDGYVKLYVDLDERTTSISDNNSDPYVIIDHDNPDMQWNNLWEGFRTGEAILSIEAYDYTGASLNLNIMDLAGYDFASGTTVVDNDAPEMTIDLGGYDPAALPDGLAGKTYPVFPATAFDKLCGSTDVEVRAFAGCDTDSMTELNITDGYIDTVRAGKYAFVYTATDDYGNTAEQTLNFFVRSAPNAITLTVSGGTSACKVGETVALPTVQANGGSGKLVIAVADDKKANIDEAKNAITPLETGTHTITYTATDITGYSQSQTFTLTVSANDAPVILDKVVLPDYLFGGLKYKFPTVKARDFNTGSDVDTEVFADGVKCDGNVYTPEDKGTASLVESYEATIQYKVGNNVVLEKKIQILDVMTKSGPIPTYNVGGYYLENHYAKTVNPSGVQFTIESATNTEESMAFAKPVLYAGFSIGLRLYAANDVADRFFVRLTDAEDSTNYVEIQLVNDKASQKTILYVNGEETVFAVNKGGFYSEEQFNLKVTNDGYVQDSGSVNYYIGDIFSADKVYISAGFAGVTAGKKLDFMIDNISGDNLNSNTQSDQVRPYSLVKGTYAKYAGKGESVEIYPVIAEDILDTFVSSTVTVTFTPSDGSAARTLLANADATVSNFITAPDYGTISINYTVTDGAGMSRRPSSTIQVLNEIQPVITYNGKVPSEVKIGSTVDLGKATAKDFKDADVDVIMIVISPAFDFTVLTDGKFVPKMEGQYILRLCAVDVNGNITIKEEIFRAVK